MRISYDTFTHLFVKKTPPLRDARAHYVFLVGDQCKASKYEHGVYQDNSPPFISVTIRFQSAKLIPGVPMTLTTVLVSLGTELAPLATVFPPPAETGIHVYLHIFILK